MRNIKRKKRIAVIVFSVAMILFLLIQLVKPQSANAQVFYLDFINGTTSTTALATDYLPNSTFNGTITLPVSGVTSYTVTINGIDYTANAALSGNTLTLSSIPGQATAVYGKAKSNPGHQIYRLPDGTKWEHQGEHTIPVQFVDPLTVMTGMTQYPGVIPTTGNTRTGQTVDYTVSPNTDLRYKYQAYAGEIFPNFSMEGAAVTHAYAAPPPTDFYFTKTDANGGGSGASITSSQVEPNSIEIYDAAADPTDISSDGSEAFLWGKSTTRAGYGDLLVRRMLGNNLDAGIDYDITPHTPLYGEIRNYFMTVDTYWQGTAYAYSGTITVTLSKPDLVAETLINTTPITVGTPTTFSFSFSDQVADVNQAFDVKVVDGTRASYSNVLYSGRFNGMKTTDPPFTGTFSYTFNSTATKTFTLIVDAANEVAEDNKANNDLSVNFGPNKPTGDFDIMPSTTINFRDTFQLVPKNFNMGSGCTYVSHQYTFTESGMPTWTDAAVTTASQTSNYPYAAYKGHLVAGSVTVTLQISSTCATSGPIPHTLTINPPAGGSPPYMKIGFFASNDVAGISPISQVVQGDKVNLRVIQDPISTPASPSDPDGDNYTYLWDFTGNTKAWVQNIGATFGDSTLDQYNNITADTVDTFSVKAVIMDSTGMSSSAYANLAVIPPNPIPVAICPAEVKENRSVNQSLFDASQSYSPVSGRGIDHSRDEWTNKLSSYVNGTPADITTQAQLNVYDTIGLKSLSPDTCSIIVHPDLPPAAKLQVPPIGIRNQAVTIYNKSYSPDGDKIVGIQYRYKYDANNNGFADDPWQPLTGDMISAAFTPSKVGKYLFYVKATEDYGKWDDTLSEAENTMMLDVVNDAPEVSFSVVGMNRQPDLNGPVTYSPNTMLGWNLYKTNTNTPLNKTSRWVLENGKLFATSGKNFSNQDQGPFNSYKTGAGGSSYNYYGIFTGLLNNGLGHNGRTPWRAGVSFSPVNSFLLPGTYKFQYTNYSVVGMSRPIQFAENKSFVYLPANGAISAVNKNTVNTAADFAYAWSKYATIRQISGYCGDDYEGYQKVTVTETTSYSGLVATDRYLYVTKSLNYSCSSCPWGLYWDGGTQPMTGYTQLVILDAITGNEIRSFPSITGSYTYGLAKGDNAILQYGDVLYEIDPYGNILHSLGLYWHPAIPSGTTWELQTGQFFWDGNNGLYRYEWYHDYYWKNSGGGPIYKGVSVVKIDTNNLTYSWMSKLKYDGPNDNCVGSWNTAIDVRDDPILLINGTQLIARSYQNNGTLAAIQTLDLATGQSISFIYDGYYSSVPSSYIPPITMYLDWNGNFQSGKRSITADGYSVVKSGGYGSYSANVYDPAGNFVTSIPLTVPPNSGGTVSNPTLAFGEFVGDGIFLYGVSYKVGTATSYFQAGIAKAAAVTTNPKLYDAFNLGQFVSTDSYADAEYTFSMNMAKPTLDQDLTGFSFGMADPTNRFSVETEGTTMYLSKYVGGSRIVLASQAYPFAANTDYTVKVKTVGTEILVWVNGIPFFDLFDGSFASGKFGLFSEKAYVSFGSVTAKIVQSNLVDWLTNYAIWESGAGYAQVQYQNIIFTDPENDPIAGSYQWTYSHTPKFLHNQGVSALNGQTYTGGQIYLDKVGDYIVTLRARDDPQPSYLYPSMVFDSYRKWSNSFQKKVVAHRRPIAQFTLWTNGDGTIGWNDTSYDPDRFDPNTGVCSPWENGIDYCATRGVMERKYWYISPSGAYVQQKLTRPTEAGTYTVYLSVRDEYGAWSNPASQTINSSGGLPPDSKPAADLTWPGGSSQSSPILFGGTRPRITWNQSDPDAGTIFKGFHVKISDESGTIRVESGEAGQWTSATSAYWDVPVDLTRGKKYQVQVRVSDGELWSDWSNVGWMVINSKPKATIISPNGYSKDNPTIINGTTQPTITWTQTDPEYNYFNYYYLQILDQNGNLVYGSNWVWQGTASTINALTIPVSLPTGVPLQARVMITDNDSSMTSAWSNTAWFKLNLAPTATLTFPTGTQANPSGGSPTPLITWTQTDPDPNTTFTQYQMAISDQNGTVLQDTGPISLNTTSTTGSYQVTTPLPAGSLVQVKVRVWDEYTVSAWSNIGWMLTNRPPMANFTWKVNPPTAVFETPAWEGDGIQLINQSTDPDGDALSFVWKVTAPGGAQSVYTSTDVLFSAAVPGNYTVQLTAFDGSAQTSVTRTIAVSALTLSAEVNHTSNWLNHHQAKGHNTQNDPKDFYSGEIFIVGAYHSPIPVLETRAWIDTTGIDGNIIRVETMLQSDLSVPNHVIGELYDSVFQSITAGLPEGLQTIHFRMTYANGVTKEQDVPVNIIGNVNETVSVHRRQ